MPCLYARMPRRVLFANVVHACAHATPRVYRYTSDDVVGVAVRGADTSIAFAHTRAYEYCIRKYARIFVLHSQIRAHTCVAFGGVQVGGALKNVFAIGAGVTEGAGLGANALAALVTRGLSEMTRLAVEMGANPGTLSGLSGAGDLFLTCYGAASRNRTVGVRLGRGEAMADILASMHESAEGVATAGAAAALAARFNMDLPIVRAVAAIVAGRLRAADAVSLLMTLPVGAEMPAAYSVTHDSDPGAVYC